VAGLLRRTSFLEARLSGRHTTTTSDYFFTNGSRIALSWSRLSSPPKTLPSMMKVGGKVGNGLGDGSPRRVSAERQHASAIIARDHEPVEDDRGQLGNHLGGERRAREEGDALDLGADDLNFGEQLSAHRRVDAVGPDEDVAFGRIAVREQQSNGFHRNWVSPGAAESSVVFHAPESCKR